MKRPIFRKHFARVGYLRLLSRKETGKNIKRDYVEEREREGRRYRDKNDKVEKEKDKDWK